MKLFMTIFGAIIAASFALAIIAAIVFFGMSGGGQAFAIICATGLLLFFPGMVVIDLAIKRYGARHEAY